MNLRERLTGISQRVFPGVSGMKQTSMIPGFGGDQWAGVKNFVDMYINNNRRTTISKQDRAYLYATSTMCYAASNFRARNIAQIPMKVIGPGGKELTVENTHPEDPVSLLPWIFRKGRNYTKTMRRMELSYDFFGYSLLFKERNDYGLPVGLKYINPTLYTVDADNWRGLRGFYVSTLYSNDQFEGYIEPDDTVYVYGNDFHDDWDGVAAVEACFLYGEADAEIAQTYAATFRNMAIPAYHVQPAPEDGFNKLDEKRAKRLTQDLRTLAQGAINTGRTIVTPYRVQWEKLQPIFRDLEMGAQITSIRESVAISFEMPIELLMPSASNYAQFEGVRRTWGHSWLIPQIEWYGEEFTAEVADEFGSGYRIEPDYREVQFLKEDVASRTNVITAKVSSSLITYDKAQDELDEEIIPELKGMVFSPLLNTPIPVDEYANLWKLAIVREFGDKKEEEGGPDGMGVDPEAAAGEELQEHNDVEIRRPDEQPVAQEVKMWIPEEQYRELKSWRRMSRKFGAKYAFQVRTLRQDIVEFIHQGFEQGVEHESLFDEARARLGKKSSQSTLLDWEADFEDFLKSLQADPGSRRRAGVVMRGMMRKYALRFTRDGLIEAGIEDGAMRGPELEKFEQLFNQQSEYISGFLDSVFEGGITDEEIETKPKEWYNRSLKQFLFLGQSMGNADLLLEFVGDDGAESCLLCQYLKGQRHRASEWEEARCRPGIDTDSFGCGGFQCVHLLTPSEGRAEGTLPTPQQIASWLVSAKSTSHDHSHAFELDFSKLPYTKQERDLYFLTKAYRLDIVPS